MSRAFVNEDAGQDKTRQYVLPKPDDPGFDEAAAYALIEGAHHGDSHSAEVATGYAWGDPTLAVHMRHILTQAESQGDDRTATLARRFLTAVGVRENKSTAKRR